MSKKTNNTVKKAVDQNATAFNFVCVCSKLPFDLRFDFNGKKYVIRGRKQAELVKAEGLILPYQETMLPDEVWGYFLKVYGDKPFIKNRIIFAAPNAKKAEDEAKELSNDAETVSGLEQVNPKDVPGIQESGDEKDDEGITV